MATNSPALVAKKYLLPFILITSLFFLWGFARSILDVLNKHFQTTMDMSKAESAWIQVMVYSAYFLMAIPAGLYITRWGYRRGVVTGLSIFALGAFMFIPSEGLMSFPFFLISLFVLGCGLAMLETAANPYAANLGDPRTGASRLNLAQSFNGLGCIFGPLIGAQMLFADSGSTGLAIPYGIMGLVVAAIAFVFTRVNLPEIAQISTPEADDGPKASAGLREVWRHGAFVFGLIALFSYEVSEIAINSMFINYVTEDGSVSVQEAALLLSVCGLGLFFLGRLIGSGVMSKVRAELVLLICGIVTVVCSFLVTLNLGDVSHFSLYAIYLFESIMFPTIFALSIKGLGNLSKLASSFLMMTPIGGAVGTMLMAYVGDTWCMSTSFVVPMVGYMVVLAYAIYRNTQTKR